MAWRSDSVRVGCSDSNWISAFSSPSSSPGWLSPLPPSSRPCDGPVQAGQLFPFLVVLRPPDGGREFVEQMSEVVFHERQRYRTSGLYLIRCGSSASAPRRFLRSAS